jgi:hypothetical protein
MKIVCGIIILKNQLTLSPLVLYYPFADTYIAQVGNVDIIRPIDIIRLWLDQTVHY